MASKGKPFRDLLKQPDILMSPGVYDGYSTRLAAA
jgi:2-methylisocitrate lyase-like PEP mutase family enzyme